MPWAGVIVGALAVSVGGIAGVVRSETPPPEVISPPVDLAAPALSAGSLDQQIDALRARVERLPADGSAWAALGLAYVEQARISGDPRYYDTAETVLQRSVAVAPDDNFAAAAGDAALAAARHDFDTAYRRAREGLAINGSNPILLGALADAAIQLGRYEEAFTATQRMVDVRPDTSSLARVSYTWELRGDTALARRYMERALEVSPSAAASAFAHHHLGELAFDSGDAAAALRHHDRAVDAEPRYRAALQGRAKAHAALDNVDAAVADYEAVIESTPLPAYVLEYGELLESLGRTDEAAEMYALFEAAQRLFADAGVAPDVDALLYEADHGDPAEALTLAEAAVVERPFVEMQDAYAWALHRTGRNREALEWSDRARSIGTRDALWAFHAGIIRSALGDAEGARRDLELALEINPHFHPIHALRARAELAAMEEER